MGLTCTLLRATAAEIEQIIDDPDRLASFVDKIEGPPLAVRTVRMKGVVGFLLRLLPITITEVVPLPDGAPLPEAPDPERVLDVDKAWHGLHFLSTGTADGGSAPANYHAEGGAELDDEGHARALRPRQVQALA